MKRRGGRFNATDIGSGPRRRIFFIAKSGNNWIVSYEHGGHGYHRHCFLITIDQQNNSIWDNSCFKIESFGLLKELLKDESCSFTKWSDGDY